MKLGSKVRTSRATRRARAKRVTATALCILMCGALPTPALAMTQKGSEAEHATWAQMEDELEKETGSLDDSEYDGYIVKLKDGVSMMMDADTEGIERIDYADRLYLADDLDAAQEFADAEYVEYVEPNYVVEMYDSEFDNDMKAVVTNVTGTENEAHLALMNVNEVRDEYGIRGEDYDTSYDMGGDGNPKDQIVIGVIDSGLDPDHEDIDYSRVLEGKSFVSTDSTTDTMGHGTFVTGEIIASTSNDVGIKGISEDVYVMPLKVFSSRSATTAIIINAIDYATEQRKLYDETHGKSGANIAVINMSLGSESASTSMKASVEDAINAGIIVVCAAGNDEDSRASYPAQYAIGVGSTNSSGERSYYSQILSEKNGDGWQNKVWVTGPGESYTSLWYTGEYYTGSGTSFSSPQVAALAAVAVSIKNDLTSYYTGKNDDDGNAVTNNHYAFRQLLKDTSKRMDNGLDKASNGQDTYYGWGMVDFKAVADKLTNYDTNKGTTGTVSFKADNGAGTELTAEKNNLAVEIREYTENPDDGTYTLSSEVVQPTNTGVYELTIGKKYQYTVTADKYTAVTKDMRVIMTNRIVYLTMEGLDYYTSFDIKDTAGQTVPNADIEVKKVGGAKVRQNVDGSFSTKNGSYTYVISVAGYFPQEGSFTINDETYTYTEQKYSIPITLKSAADICSVTFKVTGTGDEPFAEVTLKDAKGTELEPYGDGAWKLEPGSYTYDIDSDYYVAVSGGFSLEENSKGTEKVITETMTRPLYWAFIDIMPLIVLEKDGTVCEVKDSKDNLVAPHNDAIGEYRIENGAYTYTVKATGYKTEKGSFEMNGKILYVDVELEEGTDPDSSGSGDTDKGGTGGSGSGDTDKGGTGGSGSGDTDKGDTGGSGSGGSGSGGSGSGGSSSGGSSSGGSSSGGSSSGGSSSGGSSSGGSSSGGSSSGGSSSGGSSSGGSSSGGSSSGGSSSGGSSSGGSSSGGSSSGGSSSAGSGSAGSSTGQTTSSGAISGDQTTAASDSAIKVDTDAHSKYENIEIKYHDFGDVTSGKWYYEAVNFVATVGLFNGLSDDTFGADEHMTRGMLVTVLYRLSEEKNESACPFADVASDAYYADAVAWAYAKGIVKGSDDTHFDPDGDVTRQQIAVMLYNYAKAEDVDVTVHGDGAVQAFTDYASVASYAESAVNWAYENEIIKGDGYGNFRAADSASRAEVASLMMGLLKNIF